MISFFGTQFSIFSVYADLNIGGKALYNERSEGVKMYLYDLDTNSKIKLNIDGNARYVYKDYGIIYTRYNQLTSSNNTYYKGFYSALEKQILPTNGNLTYFNKENGDFIYQINEYINGNRNYYYYKKNIFNDYNNTLILSGINTRIQSISPDLTKIIYQSYDSSSGINKVFLKNISTGEEVSLGVLRIQTETSYTNYDYRFFGSNNELLKSHYIYNYTNNSNSRDFSLINISDFNNFTYTDLELNLGNNGGILGRKGTDIYYQTIDETNWTNHIFLKRGSDITEIFSGNYSILTNRQNSTILGYGDYIFYQYRDNNINKNIIRYKNTVTGEDGILFHGNISPDTLYIRDKNTSEDSGFCSGDILTCGQFIENFSQIGGLIYKNYSNKIGFIGTNYQENSQINEFSGNIGYLGNNNTYGTGISSNFAGSLGYIGNNNTYGTGTNNELASNIGYIGNSYNYSTGENTLGGNIGFIGNNYTNTFSNISINSNIVGYFGQKDIIPEGKRFTFDAQVGLLLGAGNKLVSPKVEKFVYDIKNLKLNKSSTTPIKTNLALTQNQKKNTILKDMLDPVDPSTGEFTYDNTLMSLPGIGLPYELSVSYKSMGYSNGSLGINWDNNYNIKIVENLNGTYSYMDGTMSSKALLALSGSFIDDIETQVKGLDASLIKYSDGSGYKISFKNKKNYLFNSAGYISEIKDANGNKLSFIYDANNLLVQVIDTLGKTIKYTYNDDNKLVKVTESGGRYVAFEYFAGNTDYGDENDLKSIKIHNSDTAEKTISFSYYLSGNDFNLSHNMKSLIDSKGHVYVVNTYDKNDRVISQSYGDGIGYYEYTLGDIHSDDSPEQVGNGEVVGTYVVKNKVTDKKGNVTEYTYNRMGNVLSRKVLDINGNEKNLVSYEYDSIGHIAKEIEARGNGIEYKYDENGNKIEERKKQDINLSDDDLVDIITKYERNLDTNLLTKIVLPDSSETEFIYDSSNNLVKTETKNIKLATDSTPLSLISENTYDELGELIKQVNPEGNETSFEYLSGQLVKTIKGNLFNKIEESYTYDNYGNLVSKTDGNGNIQTLSYDELNRLTETTSAQGIKKQYTYDANDNKEFEKQILEGGSSIDTKYDYNLLDKPTSIFTYIDSNTRVGLLNIYDKNENISETIYPNGLKKQFVYDENENLVEEKIIPTEANEVISNKYTYDINGNKIQAMDSKGNSVYFEYDLFDRAIKTTDSLGNYTIYTYDKLGHIIGIEMYNSAGKRLKKQEVSYNEIGKVLSEKTIDLDIDGNPKTTDYQDILKKYEYNKNGQVTKTIDAKSVATLLSYDIFGRLIETTDSLGNKIKNTYDKNNNITSKEILENNGKSTITSYTYDKDNRLISEKNNLNKTKSYTYNSLNQIISTRDENGNTINYTYDYRGKVLSETKYLKGNPLITNYSYDISGNLIKLTDTNGNITNYEYDSLGRQTKQIYPNGQVSTKTYDTNNNVLTTTDPNGNIITNTYDSLNRLVSRNIQTGAGVEGTTNETYSYDDLSRLKESNDSNNNLLSFEYDSKDNLVKETSPRPVGIGRISVNSNYDSNGNITSITNPNGNITNYTYDDLNRLTSIGKDSQNIANYNYSGLENTAILYANTKQINQTFDELNRLASLDNGVK
ncbi:MAG: DUF6531 domain-containing protein, partial [Candidatus Gracilibacteria bacterium]|nr:DUF6531 domain-containing protein [Candidatus Gracilibacteria bacterium]